MTDRELLELAAKAAGIPKWLYDTRNGMAWNDEVKVWRRAWNPLTNGDDALMLVVMLKLGIEWGMDRVYVDWNDEPTTYLYEDVTTDPDIALRRAIVRAAAEIGKNMT
jgi:hypothetical protein